MASKALPLSIGPFIGGLNTYSDPSAIGDTEVAYINNFDVDLDGSLVSRPPITRMSSSTFYDVHILGTYTSIAGVSYIIYSATDGTTNYLRAFNIVTNAHSTISSGTIATFNITCMVVYQGKAWFIQSPIASGNGGSWDGTTFTAVAAIAHGVSACVYKERIFVASGIGSTNTSQVVFSNAALPTTWTGTDIFLVSNGDGQPITKIYSIGGSIACFKTDSTYVFAYESSPTKGQVQSVSATIGIDNTDCLIESEGVMYLMYASNIYSIQNWNWEQLNIKVPFAFVNANGSNTRNTASVSVIGQRLICRYYDSIYVFGMKTRAWTRWTYNSTLAPDFWIKSPIKDAGTSIRTYYAGNYLNTNTINSPYIHRLKDTYTAVDIEAGMVCEIRTKIYDQVTFSTRTKAYTIAIPYTFKRLCWWGVDLLANSTVNAQVIPVTFGIPVTWAQIAALNLTWAQRGTFTWANPLDTVISVSDTANVVNLSGVRMFVKYMKSLRFRQIQFILFSTIDGSTVTGPFRIFSIKAFIINKEKLTKQIS